MALFCLAISSDPQLYFPLGSFHAFVGPFELVQLGTFYVKESIPGRF